MSNNFINSLPSFRMSLQYPQYLSSSVLNITQIIQYKVPGIGPKLNEMMLEIHTNASANDLITENSKIDKPWYKTTELKLYVAQIHR